MKQQYLSSLLSKGFGRKQNVTHIIYIRIIICGNCDNDLNFSSCFSELADALQTKCLADITVPILSP